MSLIETVAIYTFIGDPIFEETALKAIRGIWNRRSLIRLVNY